MNVLSLFDGISACHLALTKARHTVDTYYTSEIDKYAEQISKKNYPDAIRLGDVTKWQEWDIDWSTIDLVTGGFPCQAWSVAGKQMGDKDPRGMLFWVMLDIMKTVLVHNPKAFFLIENVKMKKEFEQYITHHTEQALGKVEKHLINSALVSAQNRQRYYWTNIQGIEQPQDKGILIKDIIETGKAPTLSTCQGEPRVPKVLCGAMRGRYIVDGKRQDHKMKTAGLTEQRLEVREDEKTNSLTTVQKDNYAVNPENLSYRKLTPTECERLQTFPDGWTDCVCKTQRYWALGNAWTVDVIAHIFRNLPGTSTNYGEIEK